MLRKLLTRPIWWWERKRPYPIRSRFHLLPPLGVKKGRVRFVVLTTPDTLDDALWTAWSWYRYLRQVDCELEIAVDGVVSAAQSAAAAELFPGIAIYPAESACNYVCQREPALETFLYGHPTGRKLALILALSDQGPLLYSDYDVLAFNPPRELLASIERNAACYFAEETDGTRDPIIVERAKSLGMDYIPNFNSGFLYIPRGALPMHAAAEILATWRPPGGSWFADQSVLSVMLRDVNAEALPPDRYVISICRQFYWERDVDYRTIAARHFTGTVRHVMYGKGMPLILRQSRESLSARSESSEGS
ncbi:MAG: hypothetical protein ABR860_05125 [Terracidiphilus sp.]|jgi:hypothetical protein